MAFVTPTIIHAIRPTTDLSTSRRNGLATNKKSIPVVRMTIAKNIDTQRVPADVRKERAKTIRDRAAILADRVNEISVSNGEESSFPNRKANFTKGLMHKEDGAIENDSDYINFVRVIEEEGTQEQISMLNLGPVSR